MGTGNPTSRTGVTAHCSSCNVTAHIPTSAVGRGHRGKPLRINESGAPVGGTNACRGKWTAGAAPSAPQ